EEEARDLLALLVTGAPVPGRVEDVWLRLVDRMAHDRPVVVVVDDLHHEPEAVDVLRALAGSRRPVLAVATVDQSAEDQIAGLREVARWESLPRLTPEQHRMLVDAGVGLVPELAEQVVERTAGDPSRAVRVVSDWAKRGRLVPRTTGFALKDRIEDAL